MPGWHLHPLKGDLRGCWAIAVNGNWRLTFRFVGADVELLDYQDYHWALWSLNMSRMHNPPHPGAVLAQWLADVSVTQAAQNLGVTRAYLSRILNGHASISADMALRLATLLSTSADMWLGLQSAYDLWQARQKPRPAVRPLARPTSALGTA